MCVGITTDILRPWGRVVNTNDGSIKLKHHLSTWNAATVIVPFTACPCHQCLTVLLRSQVTFCCSFRSAPYPYVSDLVFWTIFPSCFCFEIRLLTVLSTKRSQLNAASSQSGLCSPKSFRIHVSAWFSDFVTYGCKCGDPYWRPKGCKNRTLLFWAEKWVETLPNTEVFVPIKKSQARFIEMVAYQIYMRNQMTLLD